MQKRSSKGPRDVKQVAFDIVRAATGEPDALTPTGKKNPAAVALGRLGGLKGGKARASSLSAKKRAEIASKAAAARWKKKSAR